MPPFDAYKGEAPYIFVSYAHRNAETVYAHISRLHGEGFRIWYDEGIDPGADWSDEIAQALVGAEVFLVFISEAAVASQNVRKEIVFAIDRKKYMVCVHVEETELPDGLKMQLGNIQALLENRFHDREKFYERLCNALRPERTRGEAGGDPPVRREMRAKGRALFSGRRWAVTGALCAVFLCVAALCWHFLPGGVTFSDRKLEAALRAELGRPQGSLGVKDLAAVKGKLDLSGCGIADIGPLRHLTGVKELDLSNNAITDVSPLGDLHGLEVLHLAFNRISDATPLQSLEANLIALDLGGNPVTDMKQLRPLKNLRVLGLAGVPITDLNLGKFLRRLQYVFLSENHGLTPDERRKFCPDHGEFKFVDLERERREAERRAAQRAGGGKAHETR